MKKLALIITVICVAALIIPGCGNGALVEKDKVIPAEQTSAEKIAEEKIAEEQIKEEEKSKEEISMDYTVKDEKNPLATILMENGDTIIIELYPDIAPQSVNNFISLAQSGFYDGVIFHRVIPGFMIQGGDPEGTGMGGPGYCIFGEYKANGFENNLSHSRGVVSMARKGDPRNPAAYYDSAGSQFFICVGDSKFLDNDYAAFGMVVSGMEAADNIVKAPRDRNDKPTSDQKIKKLTVDTKGTDYPEPEKLPVK
jgi:peptidyl-prolyl cis-trans isomerase B (cyclophilin B)